MNTNYKVSYAFVQLPDMAIADFTEVVVNALTGNASFPALPVALATMGTQQADFLAKLAATAQGGTLATAEKNAAREVLVTSLRHTAAYVQSVASQDLSKLLSRPVSRHRARTGRSRHCPRQRC